MADKKVSELSAITNLSGDDLLLVVNDPSGTPTSNKVTVTNLFANVVPNVVHKGTVTARANTTFSGTTMTVSANATYSGTLTVSGTLVESGISTRSGVQVFNGNTIHNDTLFANGGLVISSAVSSGGSNIIGKNGNLNANNAIASGTITDEMLYVTPIGNTVARTLISDRMQVANVVTQTGINSITFDTTAGVSVSEAQIAWNDVDGTFDLGMKDGAATLQLGQEQYAFVTSNGAIENGQPVYFDGHSPNGRLSVAKMSANDSIETSRFIGLATQNISNGQTGYVTTFGIVREIDTRGTVANTIAVGDESGWGQATPLFVSPTEGKLTATKPRNAVRVGFVIESGANGSIFVAPQVINSLSELSKTNLSNTAISANGTFIKYNSSNNTFHQSHEILRIKDDPATSNAVTENYNTGEIFASNTYLYVVTDENTIKRITLEAF